MKITWYGHSCFRLESVYGSVVFDPYEDGFPKGLRLPPLEADLVICSHSHGDHCAEGRISLTGREPECRTEQLFTWHDAEGGAKRGMNTVTVVSMEGLRVAHLGDLGHELSAPQLRALGHIDALMLPVGGFYTIDAATARRVADAVSPNIVIPMHYRGEGFGLDELDTVDKFAALSPDVEYLDGNSLEIRRGERKRTVVFSL